MVELSAEWALVIVSLGLVVATVVLAWFTAQLVKASKALEDQAKRQVEVAKLQAHWDAARQGIPQTALVDEDLKRI